LQDVGLSGRYKLMELGSSVWIRKFPLMIKHFCLSNIVVDAFLHKISDFIHFWLAFKSVPGIYILCNLIMEFSERSFLTAFLRRVLLEQIRYSSKLEYSASLFEMQEAKDLLS
jgi:hypothetical protein